MTEMTNAECVIATSRSRRLYQGVRAAGPLWSGSIFALPGALAFVGTNYREIERWMNGNYADFENLPAENDYSPAAVLFWSDAAMWGAVTQFAVGALCILMVFMLLATLHRRLHGIATIAIGASVLAYTAYWAFWALSLNPYLPTPEFGVIYSIMLLLALAVPVCWFGWRMTTLDDAAISAARRMRPRAWRIFSLAAYVTGLPPALLSPTRVNPAIWVVIVISRSFRNIGAWGAVVGMLVLLPALEHLTGIPFNGGFQTGLELTLGPWQWALLMIVVAQVFALLSLLLTHRSLDAARKSDRRPPILYLRPFSDDRVKLKSSRRSLLRLLTASMDDPHTLEDMLTQNIGGYGPVVAIGNPKDRLPQFGAARAYLKDSDWQAVVLSLMEESQLIVLCVSDTDGMRWEFEQTIRTGHSRKTIYIMHPGLSAEARRQFLVALGITSSAATGEFVIAAAVAEDGARLYTCDAMGAGAYACVLQQAGIDTLGWPKWAAPLGRNALRDQRKQHPPSALPPEHTEQGRPSAAEPVSA